MRLCYLVCLALLVCEPAGRLHAKQVAEPTVASEQAAAEHSQLDSAAKLDQEALQLVEDGKLEDARERVGKALQLRTTALGRRDVETISSIETYGLLLETLGRYSEAEPYFTEAVTLSVEVLGNRHPETLARLSGAAGNLEKLGRDSEAEQLHSIALNLRTEVLGAAHWQTLESLEDYALVVARLGRLSEAERSLGQVIAARLAAHGPNDPATLKARHNYASIARRLGRLDEAEKILSEVLHARREVLGPSDLATINTLTSLGVVLAESGKPDQAEPFLQDALRLNREMRGDRHPETLHSLSNYAGILATMGRLSEAERLYDDALLVSIETLGYDHPRTVMIMAELADLVRQLGPLEKAEEFLKAAIAEVGNRLGREHPSTIRLANNYAQILVDLDRLESARSLQAEVLELARQELGEAHPNTLSYARNHARILASMGQADAALPILADVLEARRTVLGDQHPDTLTSIGESAQLAFAADRVEQALGLSRQWVSGLRERRRSLAEAGLKGEGQAGRTAGVRRRAEAFLADALRANLQTSGVDQKALGREAFEALQLASNGSASRAVAEAAAARFAIDRGVGGAVRERQALVREWIALEVALVENQVGGESAAAARRKLRERLDAVEIRLAEINAGLRSAAPEFFAILSQDAVELEDIRNVIGPDEAMLLLVPTVIGTHMMVASQDASPWSWSSLDAETIAAKVDELRQGLEVTGGGRLPVFDFALAHELYTELIAPVESALEGKKRVYVVADGALSRLPLGVLLTEKLDADAVEASDGDNGNAADPVRGTLLGGAPSGAASTANDPEDFARAQWLADRYALVNLPSLQSLVFIRTFGLTDEDIEGSGYTGFGDPILARHASQNGSRSAGLGGSVDAATMLSRGGSNEALMNPASLKQMASLPGTKRELEQVSQLLGASDTSLFLGEAMTEPAIRNADLSKTRILHLATHGLTSEEGGRLGDLAEPGLVFTPPERSSEADDGYLSASEVVGLNLTLADWVILSACNTAAPSGKAGETGLSGLAQAFFYAGAESLLVSHWPVFDSVAPILTAETLARAQQGTPRAEAFQQAMQAVRETNPHPAAWAPFVLVGEGR